MDDLSRAVIVYLRRYPGYNIDEFTARFPEPDTEARVHELLAEALRVPEPQTTLSLEQIGEQACGHG